MKRSFQTEDFQREIGIIEVSHTLLLKKYIVYILFEFNSRDLTIQILLKSKVY